MALAITYFVHGTTTDNEQEISSGWSDVGLSDRGIQQSKDLAGMTADRRFEIIFASDLRRAVESAEITWGGAVEIVTDARLRECNYGDLNGQPSRIVEPLQVRAVTTPMPHGESYEDVKNRVASFIAELKKGFDGKQVAIVAHKAPQLALDVLLKGKTWEEAFEGDWRKTKSWQPGWEYLVR